MKTAVGVGQRDLIAVTFYQGEGNGRLCHLVTQHAAEQANVGGEDLAWGEDKDRQ